MRNRHHRIRINTQDKDKTYSGAMYLSFYLPEGENDSSGIRVLTLPEAHWLFSLSSLTSCTIMSVKEDLTFTFSVAVCFFSFLAPMFLLSLCGACLQAISCRVSLPPQIGAFSCSFLHAVKHQDPRGTSQLHKILVKNANFRQCSKGSVFILILFPKGKK